MMPVAAKFRVQVAPVAVGWLLSYGICHGQAPDSATVLKRARHDIAILASDSLAGRGYVAEGHVRAAHYLAGRFRQLGLTSGGGLFPGEEWFQRFRFQTNLITDATLTLDKKQLVLGQDFLPFAASGNAPLQQFAIVDVGLGTPAEWNKLASKVGGSAVLIRVGALPASLPDSTKKQVQDWEWQYEMAKQLGARALLLSREKLIHAFAPIQVDLPVLEIKASSLPKRTKRAELKVAASLQQIVSQNVVGTREANVPDSLRIDSTIIVCAHYDHLGRIGISTFYGASDNASGTAFLLALIEQLRTAKLRYRLVFIAFGAEETGLNGAYAFAKSPSGGVNLRQTQLLLNFDLVGAGPAVMAVGAKEYQQLYRPLQAINAQKNLLPVIQQRPNAPNSDHWPFTQRGIPALFLYTLGGPGHYHDIFDKPDTLPLTGFFNLLRLTTLYVQSVAGVPTLPE